jgi:hypothetical protein
MTSLNTNPQLSGNCVIFKTNKIFFKIYCFPETLFAVFPVAVKGTKFMPPVPIGFQSYISGKITLVVLL